MTVNKGKISVRNREMICKAPDSVLSVTVLPFAISLRDYGGRADYHRGGELLFGSQEKAG